MEGIKNVLIKGSGDVTDSQKFFDFAVEKALNNYVLVICGGGTKISLALESAGYTIEFDELGSRITKTWEERIIMRNVLENEEKRLQDEFVGKGIVVESPILYGGKVLCPINGDDLVWAYRIGYDEIYVFTTMDRVEEKKHKFHDIPKVKVAGI